MSTKCYENPTEYTGNFGEKVTKLECTLRSVFRICGGLIAQEIMRTATDPHSVILRKILHKSADRIEQQPLKFYTTGVKSVSRPPNVSEGEGGISEKESHLQLAAAFGRPPIPPFFGPFFLFSLLEMLFKKKENRE